MLNGLLKVTFVGLTFWGAVTWLGAGFTALGIATLAVLLATMGLDSTNRHTTELKRLRENITTLEENLSRSHERTADDIDRVREQNRWLSEQLEAMQPKPPYHDY